MARQTLLRYFRVETLGGILLLLATVLALLAVNSGLSDLYTRLRDTQIGIDALHLKLSLGEWTTDGLLAIFFYVIGLELKRELVVGELRSIKRAIVPLIAAVGGMIVPALVCLLVGAGQEGISRTWPIPIATDIAFALAVLAMTASALPASLRIFLLSMAVVDDLGSILLIAALFTSSINFVALGATIVLVGAYFLAQRLRITTPLLYIPLALAVWYGVHESGIHATVAGIALGLATRTRTDAGESESPALRLEHRLQPYSAFLCVPIFAFFAAGIPINAEALRSFANDRLAWAVMAGLLIGKFVGVFGATLLAVKLGIGKLGHSLYLKDVAALAVLGGCGFTVSLLMNTLAFGEGAQAERLTLAVLVASLASAITAAIMLRIRIQKHPAN